MPVSLLGYFKYSRPLKTINAASANPADQLKERKVNIKREMITSLFLGSCIGLGIGIILSLSWVIDDYKNNRGLFAPTLSITSIPAAPKYDLPAVPPEISKDQNTKTQAGKK